MNRQSESVAEVSGTCRFPYWDVVKVQRRFKRSAAAPVFCLISYTALQLLPDKKNAALKDCDLYFPEITDYDIFVPFSYF